MGKKSRKGRKKDPHEVTIPPGTAPGSKLTVPLPDGRNLTLTTPPGSKPGDCISLKEVDRAKNGHPSIALASGPDVDGSGRLRDILAKTRELERAASRSAVARPPAGMPPPGRVSSPTPPASSIPLTDDEKHALAQSINGLTHEKLDLVVATLEETSGAVTPSGGGDGSRVDLNTLDPTALRSLQQFVSILSATQPLTLSSLASMPAEHQKNLVGERLYPLVRRVHPELAGKITGMLLELDNAALLHLIETPDALRLKVDEAIEVLKQWHQDPSKPVFPIVVKAGGEDVMLEVVGSLTIHQVKELLNGRVPAPPIGRWGIIFKGVVLEDGRTLASYDIQTNSELILMPIVEHPPDRATATPPPPPAAKPVDDLQARRISIAAAVAEAAAKDVPPSEDANDNERFCSAIKVLLTAILDEGDDEDARNCEEYVDTFNGRHGVRPEEWVKRVKLWPRLRKYWPRLRRRFCSYCGKGTLDLSAPRLLVCGGCGQDRGVGRYCSEACQRADWPEHREVCPAIHTAPAHRQSTLRKTANTVLIGVLAHLGPSALRDLGTEMLEASLARTS